jgi:Tol biopolymer transport system component
MEPDIGTVLERLQSALATRYRIERELGRGGMGMVFLAEDLKHGRLVALKVLRPELAQSLGPDRFLREIRVSAQLNHPHILTLIDSGSADGFMYYVLPFVEGESLRDRLTRERNLSIDDALRITEEVADALAYAHSTGVVHRDIKPENILFEAGHAVVTDFGIAHAVSEAGGERLTQTGLAVGTPAYMSPEQALGTEAVDGRADIYSLGCVLYEMLTGEPPYTGPTPQAILARKAVDPVPGIRVVREAVPAALEAVVERALAKVPADRYESAHDFAAALSGGETAVRAPRRTVGWRPDRFVMVASAIVVIAAVSYLALALSGGGSSPGVAVTSFERLTTDPGQELFPSISSDGEWIVYAGETAGNRDIFLRRVDGENAINLTPDSPADDDQPVFSADGGRIAFRSERDGGGIFVMGRTGEAVRRVTREGFSPTWSPDGKHLAFAIERIELHPQNSEGPKGLWVIEVESGAARQISDRDMAMPSWSPNGHRIAFTGRLGGGEGTAQSDVWTVTPEGEDAVPVTQGVVSDWNPAWSPDGRYLYFASNRSGSMNLWRVRINERSGIPLGEPEPVTTPATSLAHISVSGDGRRIVYSSVLVTANIQRATMDPHTGTLVGEPSWLTTGSRRWSSPDPSADGATVAFYSLTEPEGDLYLVRADGSGLRRVTGDSANDRVPRWSPDGEWIAFFSNRGPGFQAWKIRPDGSDLRQLTERGSAVTVWAPTGTRFAAVVRDVGVCILDADRPWADQDLSPFPAPDSTVPGFRPNAWSPDGEWLAADIGYLDEGIVIYSMRSQTYTRLTDFGQWPVWLPDNRRILFVSGGNGFYLVDRETAEVRQIYASGRDVVGPPRLTQDGRTVYYSRRITEADVWRVDIR